MTPSLSFARSALAVAAALTFSASVTFAAGLPAPLTDADFPTHANQDAKVELGKLLFWDKILSGKQNISCAGCHHAFAGTGDGLSLPVGAGGVGIGVTRVPGVEVEDRVPRNAPFIFNMAANGITTMFHDGRVSRDAGQPSGFKSPAGLALPAGLDTPMAVQAMFPVTSNAEMAGPDEVGNPQGQLAAAPTDFTAIWELIAQRLRDIPEYVDMFIEAFDDIAEAADIEYFHAANAIGAFEDVEFRSINTPFDRALRGSPSAMSSEARRGMRLFFGRAGCSTCHSGSLLTDEGFHAIAMPQIGQGKGDPAPGGDNFADLGLGRETGDPADNYKFRTPTLRNVALTAPYGHDGAYATLEAVIRHHLDPVNSLEAYDTSQAVLPTNPGVFEPDDFGHHNNATNRAAIAAANTLAPINLRERHISDLLAFMQALTDPAALDLRDTVPASVPSGLPVFD